VTTSTEKTLSLMDISSVPPIGCGNGKPKTLDDLYYLIISRDEVHRELSARIRENLHKIRNTQQNQIGKIAHIESELERSQKSIDELSSVDLDAIAKGSALEVLKTVGLDDKDAVFDMHDLRKFLKKMKTQDEVAAEAEKKVLNKLGLDDKDAAPEIAQLRALLRRFNVITTKVWMTVFVLSTAGICGLIYSKLTGAGP